MHNLSILIPTYNDICLPLVQQLKAQADSIDGLNYEIVVADDGSKDNDALNTNRKIEELQNCRFIQRAVNTGRAAIRNFLAQQAQYEWLIFVDCEVLIPESFISKYATCNDEYDVVCGGVSIGGDAEKLRNNLRYLYEKAAEGEHSVDKRREKPYLSFRTTNFMIRKTVLLQNPFDEEIRTYGYEDVMFGKRLAEQDNRIRIEHIDNAVSMYCYEDNALYISKMEEAMRTLRTFATQLEGYSPLLNTANKLRRYGLAFPVRAIFRLTRKALRSNLTGQSPQLTLFKFYKLGYLMETL